jgi:hypothetical protein
LPSQPRQVRIEELDHLGDLLASVGVDDVMARLPCPLGTAQQNGRQVEITDHRRRRVGLDGRLG